MYSVTNRINHIKQPYGGYIRPRDLEVVDLNDDIQLHEQENINGSLVGLAVDYLTRYAEGASLEDSFKISLIGASRVNKSDFARELINGIKGFDNKSIINVCKLVGFDVAARANIMAYSPVEDIQPDFATIFNIKTMVDRSTTFFEEYGPIVKDGFTFEGGYTKIISSGDGDFLTKNALWDIKVLRSPPKTQHTLQLLVYYLMGQHSIHEEFQGIEKLGIFNPRLNKIYLTNVNDIPPEVISEVSREVIGY